jgi:hypothetical protein
MATSHSIFQEALELVESLSDDQQDDLMDIVRRRRVERRRDEIAERAREAQAAYARGDVRRGTEDDLLNDAEQ